MVSPQTDEQIGSYITVDPMLSQFLSYLWSKDQLV